MGASMSYTIEQLDTAVEEGVDAGDDSWAGWHELLDGLETTSQWVVVPEGTPNAHRFSGGIWKSLVPLEVPGVAIPGIGQAVLVEDHGGSEGSGEERWFVFEVTDPEGNKRIFRRDGYYASFDGSYFDGPTEEVKPVEKLVTVWEPL